MKAKILLPFLFALPLAACGLSEYPFDTGYEPTFGYERERHPLDEGFAIDGVLDEEEYFTIRHFDGHKISGEEWAFIDAVMYFGENGVYIGIDVTENTQIYVNPYRATYINSGIEMYLSSPQATAYSTPFTLEVDMVADGTLMVKRNIGGSSYGMCEIEDANNPYLATLQKEEQNGVYGYTHEIFMPYTFFQRLEFVGPNEKIAALNSDFAHISSRNYEGNNSGIDRNYYSFASKQLDSGSAWVNPQKTYNFTKERGFVCYELNIEIAGNGQAYESFDYSRVVPKNSSTLFFRPGHGSLSDFQSLTINGIDHLSSLKKSYENGLYTLIIPASLTSADVNVNVTYTN